MALQVKRFAFDCLTQNPDRPRDVLMRDMVQRRLRRRLLFPGNHCRVGIGAFKELRKVTQFIEESTLAQFIGLLQMGLLRPLPNYPQ